MILDKIKHVIFCVIFYSSIVVISSAYDVLHLFMEQSYLLSHPTIIRVVLEDKVITSNTARMIRHVSASTQITWGQMFTLKKPHIIYRSGRMILSSWQYRRHFIAQGRAFTD